MEDVRPMEVNGRAMFGRLGKVERVRLEVEGHGILTVWVTLDYGGGGQGFGGYALDEWHKPWDRRRGTACGADFVIRLLRAFGASRLDQIEGRYCYAVADDDRHSSPLRGLVPLPMDGGEPFLVADWIDAWGLAREAA